jgi:DNA-binding response OmpR family regulator
MLTPTGHSEGRGVVTRVLVVDDEPDILQMVADALSTEGYEIDTASNGSDAVAKAALQPDLLILDVMLPDASGYAVCQAIRDTVRCPIIFLSAWAREADRIQGLAAGGDDYLAKPFSVRELRARVAAHLRRERRAAADGARRRLRFGTLEVDLDAHTVSADGRSETLTRREFEIVELLIRRPGQVFTKEQIYDTVWGADADGDATTIAEHIRRIRAKLAALDPHTPYIATLWGVGYKWDVTR